MLDDVFSFVVEWVLEDVVEDSIKRSRTRIRGHPYLTCIYRGAIVSVLVLVGLTIWHYTNDISFIANIKQHLFISAAAGAIISGILLIITVLWQVFSSENSDD